MKRIADTKEHVNRYKEHNDSLRELSKQEQEELLWQYHDDSGLQLIYKSFPAFVYSRTGIKSKGANS